VFLSLRRVLSSFSTIGSFVSLYFLDSLVKRVVNHAIFGLTLEISFPLDDSDSILFSMNLSNSWRYIFDKSGDRSPPWGTPFVVPWWFPFSTYPARTSFQYRSINRVSLILFFNRLARILWSTLSKYPFMSPSMAQVTPFHLAICFRAE